MNVPLLLLPKVGTAYLYAKTPIGEGISVLRESGFSAIPVLYEDGRYFGTVSSGDFLSYVLDNGTESLTGDGKCVADIVTPFSNPAVNIDASLHDLLVRLMDSNFVPVVDGRGCFAGIITRKKLLGYLQDTYIPQDWGLKTGT